MKAYYSRNSGYVVSFSDNFSLDYPFIEVLDIPGLIEQLNTGMTPRVQNQTLIFEANKTALLANIRAQRQQLLDEADARLNCLRDCALIDGVECDASMVLAIATYRQALRDIVETDDPGAIVWPQKPWVAAA